MFWKLVLLSIYRKMEIINVLKQFKGSYQENINLSLLAYLPGERGSMFSKLLRVPGRRRIASFAAQFPPPEWNDSQAPVIHLHSVAVQTSTQVSHSRCLLRLL